MKNAITSRRFHTKTCGHRDPLKREKIVINEIIAMLE